VLISDQMVSILVPTYNAGPSFRALLDALGRQQLRLFEIIVVDSSSSDETLSIAKSQGVQTHRIAKQAFDHGGTRNFLGTLAKGDILVYLTQDALPVDDTSVPALVSSLLTDDRIAAAFGRQIPQANATAFAAHLRTFNYPAVSHTRTIQDCEQYGMKTFFCSNSFAAYKRKALGSVGWFKEGLLMGEDMYVCARMLLKGYHIAYAADAVVYHSHNYSVRQEFKRYFDLGAFFNREPWILERYGNASSEGFRFVRSELSFLLNSGLMRFIPVSLLRNAAKWCGYQLGLLYPYLPSWLIRRVSMHSN
jgi:GT2 family glycosyltransferase